MGKVQCSPAKPYDIKPRLHFILAINIQTHYRNRRTYNLRYKKAGLTKRVREEG